MDESAQPDLKGKLAALDGVLKVDGAALLVLRDQPFAAAGLAHLIAADARSADIASKASADHGAYAGHWKGPRPMFYKINLRFRRFSCGTGQIIGLSKYYI